MDHRRGEAQDRTADGAPAGDEFEGQVGADDLQARLRGEGVQFLGALAAVGEVAGGAVDRREGADGFEVAAAVHDAGLHEGRTHEVGALGDAGRAEAGPGPGEVVGGDGDTLGTLVDRHGGEDLDASAGGRGETFAGLGGDRGEDQVTGAGAAALAVPADEAFAAGQLGDELHGRGAVVDDDQVLGPGDGQQELYVAGERVAHHHPPGPAQQRGQAGDGVERGRRTTPGLLPAHLVPLVPGQFRHPAQLAPGHGVVGRQDHEGEPGPGRPGGPRVGRREGRARAGVLECVGVRPLQHVQQLYRALDEGESVGAGGSGAGAHRRVTVP